MIVMTGGNITKDRINCNKQIPTECQKEKGISNVKHESGNTIKPVESVDLSVATRWSDEIPETVMLPREEPLSIKWSSLKHKHLTGPACILQLEIGNIPTWQFPNHLIHSNPTSSMKVLPFILFESGSCSVNEGMQILHYGFSFGFWQKLECVHAEKFGGAYYWTINVKCRFDSLKFEN